MVRHGTTTVAAYCSVHKESAEAFFAEAHERNMLIIAGKVMMDRNAPEGLRDTPQSGYDDTKALIADWHGKGRAALCHHAALRHHLDAGADGDGRRAGRASIRTCHMQTHLSENHAEIAFTQELYPWSRDYTDVYEHYGLLGDKSLFGHCIHLSEREADALSASRLGRGVLPDLQPVPRLRPVRLPALPHARDKPLRIATATDVGGGTNYSMLRTMDEGYKVIALQRREAQPARLVLADHRAAMPRRCRSATGSARWSRARTPTSSCSIRSATPAMRLRMETVETLAEELFLLQTLGDDRAVRRDLRRRAARQERAAGLGPAGDRTAMEGTAMDVSDDIATIARQEATLVFAGVRRSDGLRDRLGDPRARAEGKPADRHRHPHLGTGRCSTRRCRARPPTMPTGRGASAMSCRRS